MEITVQFKDKEITGAVTFTGEIAKSIMAILPSAMAQYLSSSLVKASDPPASKSV